MAILERNGALRGTAGTVVFRTFRGMTVVQGLPKRNKKQTLASKASAGEFGLASSAAACIRSALKPVFRHLHDGGMVNRFNSAVYRSILGSRTALRGARDLHDGDPGSLEGFEFNADSPLSQALKIKPSVTLTEGGRIRVRMEALDSVTGLKVPEKIKEITDRYRLRFLVTAFNFRQEYYEYVSVKDLTVIKWKALESQDFEMEGVIPEGCMVMVTAALECLTLNETDKSIELVNTPSFSPAAIVAVFQSAENLPLEQSQEAIREAWRHHPGLGGYTGNRWLKEMAEQREKLQTASQTYRQKASASGPPGNSTRGKRAKAADETEENAEASFVIGRRFSF